MGIDVAITIALALLSNAGQISMIIQQAKAEGRDTLTPEEWAIITSSADSARASLVSAIQAAP